jgi:hypothetical protein
MVSDASFSPIPAGFSNCFTFPFFVGIEEHIRCPHVQAELKQSPNRCEFQPDGGSGGIRESLDGE